MISIYSSTECRVFHNVTLLRKTFTFYIKVCYYLNVQLQGERLMQVRNTCQENKLFIITYLTVVFTLIVK